mmetsp:Transcript_36856/g.91762  ORF Transcript_36856/g.91762 Transcript_36856/m.91762 type:complete len:202 (+) Transcript_36856:584-1189(+)
MLCVEGLCNAPAAAHAVRAGSLLGCAELGCRLDCAATGTGPLGAEGRLAAPCAWAAAAAARCVAVGGGKGMPARALPLSALPVSAAHPSAVEIVSAVSAAAAATERCHWAAAGLVMACDAGGAAPARLLLPLRSRNAEESAGEGAGRSTLMLFAWLLLQLLLLFAKAAHADGCSGRGRGRCADCASAEAREGREAAECAAE